MVDDDSRRPSDVFSLADIGKSHETRYEIEEQDEKSLREIKKMLAGRLYRSKQQAHEHLLYLGHLENRLAHIFSEESKAGMLNQPLESFLGELPGIIRKLNDIIGGLP